ncbi:hypothetical protein BDV26DRAFT_298818 [Aspergillus bertholletiae]|uniref:Uncharacterized protein n=1 Tax=Aspergillus bertholletiae TaxID=1226010 RepID=A0A5N7ANH2_9EURO|nr:hypothetical protein BDV26DRAFT_298818 [Aspergillus bertholletiae]
MDRKAQRTTVLPESIQDVFRLLEDGEQTKVRALTKTGLPPIIEDSVVNYGESPKALQNEVLKSAPKRKQENDICQSDIQYKHPSEKYLISWEVNQAGRGWLGLENCVGYLSKVVIKKQSVRSQQQASSIRCTNSQHLANLHEIFIDKACVYLIYSYYGFAIDLAVACVTPHVAFSEADIATICRSTLKGLIGWIHKNWCVPNTPAYKIYTDFATANIGRSLLVNGSLEGKREDIKDVGLLVIHLNDPATILEDRKLHLYNPVNVSKRARSFIEDLHSATCGQLLQAQQCSLLDPGSYITAVIKKDSLLYGLDQAGIESNSLLDPINPPSLPLENTTLLCLRGRDLLEAARRILPPGQRWLIVKLYSDDVPETLRLCITEGFSCTDGVSSVEIFQALLCGDYKNNANSWRHRLPSSTDVKYTKRVLQDDGLRAAFATLTPFPGLWETFTFRKLEPVVAPRCYEVMIHYLKQIFQLWSWIFPDTLAQAVDARSVKLIEGMMPKYSLEDRSCISEWMNDGSLFPQISRQRDRERVLANLLQVSGRVLSLSLFFEDARCFSGPSRAIRDLFAVGPKESVYNTAFGCWDGNIDSYCIQVSDTQFKKISCGSSVPPEELEKMAAWISLLQLWMVSFRNFINPRIGREKSQKTIHPLFELRGEPELARLADKLGFKARTNKVVIDDSNIPAFTYVFETLSEASGAVLNKRTAYMAQRFRSVFPRSTGQNSSSQGIPDLSTNYEYLKTSFRAGRPHKTEYIKDRSFFFLQQVYCPDQEASRYPSSFAVMRDIFLCFFGGQNLVALLHGSNQPEESQGIHQHSQAIIDVAIIPQFNPESENIPQETIIEHQHEQHNNNQDSTGNQPRDISNRVGISSQPSTPVELGPHPSGPHIQEMDDIQRSLPLAVGFEEEHCKAPISQKTPISSHKSAIDQILPAWSQSGVKELVVFFLFNTREYYKFYASDKLNMQLAVNNLARSHYFLIIEDDKVQSPTMEDTVNEAIKQGLLLVGTKGGAKNLGEAGIGVTKAELEEYISNYDVRTGKRRALANADNPRIAKKPITGR